MHIGLGWEGAKYRRCKQLQSVSPNVGVSQPYVDVARSVPSHEERLHSGPGTPGKHTVVFDSKNYDEQPYREKILSNTLAK